jgi:hypothetical protein
VQILSVPAIVAILWRNTYRNTPRHTSLLPVYVIAIGKRMIRAIAESLDDEPESIDFDDPRTISMLAAIHIMKATGINMANTLKASQSLMAYLVKRHSEYGHDALVRIRADIFNDALSGEFKFRDFTVLCGVYAVLGGKQYAKISRERITAAALGFKSAKIMPPDCVPLTTQQLRDTLDRLETAGLITRFCPNRRHAYYSNRLSVESLRLLVGEAIVRKESLCKSKRLDDLEYMQKIRLERAKNLQSEKEPL